MNRETRPLTVAHRGASGLAPPNTLRAVEVAIDFGLDFIEVDVHLSRDGELVVVHDAEVRLGGRRRAVAGLAAADLARVELGEGQGVPRLAGVLALARGRIGVYVELKGPRTGVAMGDLVRRRGADGVRLICGSFETALVDELRAAAPAVP
ncbi:MAG: glycerophosphodiester phosphodiesterase, partial [Chloroflexota bacterium]|nr:glycerophosphodiester phosphodiesterase [Chloroflexota bacterium]